MADSLGEASGACANCHTALPEGCVFCPQCGAGTAAGRLPGPVIGGYRIVRMLGQGGSAVVYLAEQESLDRQVAVKVLRRDLEDPKVWRQFRREARTIARLTGHPNVVTVYTAGRSADGRPYLVTEYLDRGSLADVLAAGGPLPPTVVAEVGVAIADALTAAHALGILHRDVKPGNVMMDRHGRVKLGDFGIARLLVGHGTTTDVFAFTPEHVAPEVLRGERDGPGSDLYGLASTLAAALGAPLFARRPDERVDALLARKLMGPPPRLPPSVPESLAAPLARSLDPDPARRPSLAELREQLATAGAALGAALPPPSPATPAGAVRPRVRTGVPAGAMARSSPSARPETKDSEPPPGRRPRHRLLAVSTVLGAAVAMTLLLALLTRRGGEDGASTATVPAAVAPAAPASSTSPAAAPTLPETAPASIASTTIPVVSTTTAPSVVAPVTSVSIPAVVPAAPQATAPTTMPTTTTTPPMPTPTTTLTPSTSAAAAAAVTPLAASDTETFVRSYYDAVNAGEYETSWSLLAPAFQRGKARSYEYYTGFWDDNDIEVGDVEVVDVDPDQTIVNVDLRWNGSSTVVTDQFLLRPGEDGQLRIAAQQTLDD